ncbi:MAG: RDD family protein [Actinomycetota bacterium]
MTLAKASYGRRILALLIDAVCTGGLAGVTIGLGIASVFSETVRPLGVGLLIISPFVVLGFQLWNAVFRQGRTGQTVGKSLMGTKLVSTETGSPVGAGSAFVRGLVAWALNMVTAGLFSIVDLLFPAFDKNGQRVVDKMLKMQVTPVSAAASPTAPAPPPAPTSARFD